jgi:hypothetical protein
MEKLTKEEVVRLIRENDRAVERALIVLFNRQTDSEKHTNTTVNYNNIGFTGADAHWGCRNAKQVLGGRHLYPQQLAYWRKPNRKGTPRLAKYWRQLAEAAAEKAAREQQRLVA